MDPSQHHDQLDMQHSDPALHPHAHYAFYHTDAAQHDHQPYPPLVFNSNTNIPNYEVVHNAHPPHMAHNSLQQQNFLRNLAFNSLPAQNTPAHHPHHPPGPYPHYSPAHSSSSSLSLPADLSHASPPPHSPAAYDPLSPPVSGSDTSSASADGLYLSRTSSGTTSPASSRGASLVHRTSLRYNPTPSPSGSASSRRAGAGGGNSRGRGDTDSDDEDPNSMMSIQEITSTRKEATRRQRIEAEQRRRDELRDGYARLKDVLPVSNQKSSKVSLLERATNYIIQLDKSTRQMQTRLAALETEVQRLRSLNEKISLSVGGTPETMGGGAQGATPMSVHAMDRPLSPPPENNQQNGSGSGNGNSLSAHNLIPVMSEPPREDSSGSENGM